MWEAQNRAEAIGPILHPSLFMANGEKLRQDGAITTALLGAQRDILRAMKVCGGAPMTDETADDQQPEHFMVDYRGGQVVFTRLASGKGIAT